MTRAHPSPSPAGPQAPTSTSPIQRLRRTRAWCLRLGAPLVVAVWAWALLGTPKPLSPPTIILTPPPRPITTTPQPLSLAAFDTPLWHIPPPPPAPPPPTPPLAGPVAVPLKLQLLAISRRAEPDSPYLAVLYDPDRDRVWTALPGTQIGNARVTRIDPSGVDLELSGSPRRLALPTHSAPSPGTRTPAKAPAQERHP